MARSRLAHVLGVAGVSGSLLALGFTVLPLVPDATRPNDVPWWVVALLCGVCEVVIQVVQVRREGHAMSLSELGIVVGLFFTSPLGFIAGRILGPLPVFLLWRRQSPGKVLFNVSLLFAESAVALLIFRTIAGDDLAVDPRTWLAALAATTGAGLLASAAVTAVIALVNGEFERAELLRELARGVVNSAWVTVIGLVAAYALSADTWALVPLAASLLLLLRGYRQYADLADRHLSLERLYRFSHAVGSSPEVDEILSGVMRHAHEVLRAEYVEVVFLSSDDDHQPLRISSSAASGEGLLRRMRLDEDDVGDPIWLEVLDRGQPRLIARGDRGARAFLARLELRDAVLAPLRGDSGIVGTIMVGNRMGDLRTFDRDDVQLLETVANHSGMALQNGRLVDRLRHDALHDALTRLPNRTLLNHEMAAALADLRSGRSNGLAVLAMDLVGFKQVNDTFGHQIGDELLVKVGERMADALAGRGLLARLGGDEFAVVVPGLGEVAPALEMAERIRAALERPIAIEGVDVEVGVSIGVAVAPSHGRDGQTLMKRADTAMYDAKRSGVGIHLYESGVETPDSPERLALVAELRHGISADEVALYVQPQASLKTGQVLGVEALARWQHPKHGLLYPDTFIPLAERTGLIKPLTDLVLEKSIAAAGRWRREAMPISVSVNLSARSPLTEDLVHQIAALLARHAVPATSLTLEITESSVVQDPPRAAEVLGQLNRLGVRLSIDDFGTGYSSLSYLRHLPVHEVKVDKSFVMAMLEQPSDAAIVRSIVHLGTNLGLDVVAEGVEDAEVEAELRAIGCALMQGFHLAAPMPIERFSAWLTAREGWVAPTRG